MTRLLYAAKYNKASLKTNGISDTMKLYLIVNAFCGATTLPYFFYKVLWWRPPFIRRDEPLYSNVLFHFISSTFNALHYGVSSILVFILCLDRCFVLKTGNLQWDFKKQRMFLNAGIFVVVAVYILCGACYSFEFPLNYETDHGDNSSNLHWRTCFTWIIFGNSNMFRILLEKM
uniref:Serpentine receptor class gamma n=1 Tax=Meloidogyne hapla TaxID=6305 RepID=A0A1I8BCP7_MELHA